MTPRERFRIWLTEYLDQAWARRTDIGLVAETVRREGILLGLDEREIIADLIAYGRQAAGAYLG